VECPWTGLSRAALRIAAAGSALPPLQAMAEEAAGDGSGGNPLTRFDPGLLIWTVLTFVAVVLLLRWKAWPTIVNALRTREERIREAIAEARRDREEAEKALEQHKAALAEARRETAGMIDQGRRDAERVRAELIETARREQQDVLQQGRRQIEYETQAAVATLRSEAVNLALAASEKLMRRSLDAEKHRRLIEEALDEVARQSPGTGTEPGPAGH
jgi:F-type H+-transporting ATPase subunit b